MYTAILQLLSQLLPVVAGLIATATFQYVKHGVAALDAAPAWVKQLLVVILASLLTWLGALLGVPVPTDPHAIDPTIWQGIIAGALALAFHAIHKGDGTAASTPSTTTPTTT